MPTRLAFFTVGVLHEPAGEARVQDFVDRVPGVYGEAGNSAGFHSRSIRHVETWKHSWGDPVVPACYRALYPGIGEDLRRIPMTFSLWDDLESVATFAYNGPHAQALGKRKEWFIADGLPTYVAWWVSEGHPMTFKQAADKLDFLHTCGPGPEAFTFAKPFDSDGNPLRLDRVLVQSKAKRNESKREPNNLSSGSWEFV